MLSFTSMRVFVVPLALCLAQCSSSTATHADATDSAQDDTGAVAWPELVLDPTTPLPTLASTTTTVRVLLRKNGAALTGELDVKAALGSGTVTPTHGNTDANGALALSWTTGPVPIAQRLKVTSAQGLALEVTATVAVQSEQTPPGFGQVDAWMTAQGLDGTTEDIAIAPDGSYAIIGTSGHLLRVDPAGDVTAIVTTGDAEPGNPLGMLFEPDGDLLFCDSDVHGLRRMTPDGVLSTLTTTDGAQPLIQPNDLARDAIGHIWFSDPCIGKLLRYDPATKTTTIAATWDLATQGGPNGVAVSPDGKWIAATTENVSLTCGKGGADPFAPLGRAWIAPMSDGPLTFTPLGEPMGIFGDGCVYDELGNLYATFDRFVSEPAVGLQDTRVVVWRVGETAPQPFLHATDGLFANVAFGRGAFGDGQLYIALLRVAPFVPDNARGLRRFAAGLTGGP